MRQSIQFFVPGRPRTAGSKRAFTNPKTGKPIVTDASKGSKPWKADVKHFAFQVYDGPPLEGPIMLRVIFHLPRPRSHYLKAGLRPGADTWHTKRPDADKLSRAVMDALTGVLWKDDAQVAHKTVAKLYSERPGATISVEALEPQKAPTEIGQ